MNTTSSFWDDDAQPDLTINQNYNQQSSSFWDDDAQPDLTTQKYNTNNQVQQSVVQPKPAQSNPVQTQTQQPIQNNIKSTVQKTQQTKQLDSNKLKNFGKTVLNATIPTSILFAPNDRMKGVSDFIKDTGKATWNGFADESILGANAITGAKNWTMDKVGLSKFHRPTEEVKAEREMYFPRFQLNPDAHVANFIGNMAGWAPSFALGGEGLAAGKISTTAALKGVSYNTAKNIRNARAIQASTQAENSIWKQIVNSANHSGQDMAVFEGMRNVAEKLAGDNPQESFLSATAKGYGMGAAMGGAFRTVPPILKGTFNITKGLTKKLANSPVGKQIKEFSKAVGEKVADSEIMANPVTATFANAINWKAPKGSKLRKYQDFSDILSRNDNVDLQGEKLAEATKSMDSIDELNWLAKMHDLKPEQLRNVVEKSEDLPNRQEILDRIDKALSNGEPITKENIMPEKVAQENVQSRLGEPGLDDLVLMRKTGLINNEQLISDLQRSGLNDGQIIDIMKENGFFEDLSVKQEIPNNIDTTINNEKPITNENITTNDAVQDNTIQKNTSQSIDDFIVLRKLDIIDNDQLIVKLREAGLDDAQISDIMHEQGYFKDIAANKNQKYELGKAFEGYNKKLYDDQFNKYVKSQSKPTFEKDPKQLTANWAALNGQATVPKIRPNTKQTLSEWKAEHLKNRALEEPTSLVKEQSDINTPKEELTAANEPENPFNELLYKNRMVDQTYTKKELESLSSSELAMLKTRAEATVKMDSTDFRKEYGDERYTYNALNRAKKNLKKINETYNKKFTGTTKATKDGYIEVTQPDGSIVRYKSSDNIKTKGEINTVDLTAKHSSKTQKVPVEKRSKKHKTTSHDQFADVKGGNDNTSASVYSAIHGGDGTHKVYDEKGNYKYTKHSTVIDDYDIDTDGYKVTKLESGAAEGSDFKPEREKTSDKYEDIYKNVEQPKYEGTPEPKQPKQKTDTSSLETEALSLREKAKQAKKSGRIKKADALNKQAKEIENTIKDIKERDSRTRAYEQDYEDYKPDEGRYNDQEIKNARSEDYAEIKELDEADINEAQTRLEKDRLRSAEEGTIYDEKYEKGNYGEAEDTSEQSAEFYSGAPEEFHHFWRKYNKLNNEDKVKYFKQYVKGKSYKQLTSLRNQIIKQEDFMAKKTSPKKVGDAFTDEYMSYQKGENTTALTEAIKMPKESSTYHEKMYGNSEGRYDRKKYAIKNKDNHTLYTRITGRKFNPKNQLTDDMIEFSIMGRFNSNFKQAQKVYNEFDKFVNPEMLDRAAKRFNASQDAQFKKFGRELYKNKITLKNRTLENKKAPLDVEKRLNELYNDGNISEALQVLYKNPSYKSTKIAEKIYDSALNKRAEVMDAHNNRIKQLEDELSKQTSEEKIAEIQNKINKEKLALHELASSESYRGMAWHRDYIPENKERVSFNRNTGRREGTGVSVDPHSEDLRQTKYDETISKYNEYKLSDKQEKELKESVKEYADSQKEITEINEGDIRTMSDKTYSKLVKTKPNMVRGFIDSLSGEKQATAIADVYNKALTTGDGLAILRGKTTTVGQVAESGNKAFKELLEQYPELKDAKVSTKAKGESTLDIDTNEITFSEEKLKTSTLPHEIRHLIDNQSKKGHALLVDLANIKQAKSDYVADPTNNPTMKKASDLVGNKKFDTNAQLYSFLRKNGLTEPEIDIIKGYKSFDSKINHHLMEKRGIIAEGGKYVADIDKELAEIEKTNQIEYRRLRNIIESIERKETNNRESRPISEPENKGRRTRFVAQEDSSVNDLKDLKFDSNGVPNKPELIEEILGAKRTDYSKEADEIINNPREFSKKSEKIAEDYGFLPHIASERRIAKQGGGYYYKKVNKSTDGQSVEAGDNLDSLRDKVGLYGHKEIEGVPDLNKVDTKKSIMATWKQYQDRVHTQKVMNFIEQNAAVDFGENGSLPKDYVPVNKYALAAAHHFGFGKEWMNAMLRGNKAIDAMCKNSNLPEETAYALKRLRQHWMQLDDPDNLGKHWMWGENPKDFDSAYSNVNHVGYHYGIPKKVLDFMLDEHGEVSQLYKERYLTGDYRGVQGSKLKYHMKRMGEINDIFFDAFKRGVLSSASFLMNNRFGNQMMLAANAENPVEYLRSFFAANKIKDASMPIELKENLYSEVLGRKGLPRRITGDEFIDTLAAMIRGEKVGLDSTFNRSIKIGTDKANYKVIDGHTVPKDSTVVKTPTLKTLVVGAGNIGIAIPNKMFKAFSDRIHTINQVMENFERRQAVYLSKNKLSKEAIEKVGTDARSAASLPFLLELCDKNPEFRTTTINAVEDILGNYRTYNKVEQKLFKRCIPFYSWYRTMARHEFQLFKKDPIRWGLIHYELAQFKNDNKDRVEWQRDAIGTTLRDKGSKLLIAKGAQIPYNTYPELFDNLLSGKNTLAGFNPAAVWLSEAVTGKHNFVGLEITDKKYAQTYVNGKKQYVNTKTGDVVGSLPLGARLNYLRKQMIDSTLYPGLRSPYGNVNYYISGVKSLKKHGKWETPDKYFDTSYGGFNNNDAFRVKKNGRVTIERREVKNNLSEKYKAANRFAGATLQKERLEKDEYKNRTKSWQKRNRKK